MIKTKQQYFNIFGVDLPQLELLTAEALSKGGDYSDIYFENTTYGNLTLRDGAVTSGGQHIDFGVGIRVLSDEKTGYAYSESTLMKDMIGAARAAAAIAEGSGRTAPVKIGEEGITPNEAARILKASHDLADSFIPFSSNGGRMVRKFFPGEPNPSADRYPVSVHWRSTGADKFLPFLEKLDAAVRSRDSRAVKVLAMLSWQVSDYLMYNSFSELKYDTRPMGSVSVSVVFQQGDKICNGGASRSFRMGVEMLTDALIEELADLSVKGLDDRFAAGRPKGGKMSVVMGAGASGILLHEAMGHAFEADFARKGQSIFTGRIGEKVCLEGINIIDDATIKGNRGALNYDDEGVPGQKTYMVEDGVLTSFLHDRISARHFGVMPTGNGRRESFRYAPIPRMRATYMESGSEEPGSLIERVKKGIFVDEFSNGQVKIGEGDFTFYVKSGYLIEDGRLTMPVKDINIIGNGPKALSDIVAVGNDLKVDESAWVCGKEQSVPVSCGIPTVLIDNLTVGGE